MAKYGKKAETPQVEVAPIMPKMIEKSDRSIIGFKDVSTVFSQLPAKKLRSCCSHLLCDVF
jgi:hypothetical protein